MYPWLCLISKSKDIQDSMKSVNTGEISSDICKADLLISNDSKMPLNSEWRSIFLNLDFPLYSIEHFFSDIIFSGKTPM